MDKATLKEAEERHVPIDPVTAWRVLFETTALKQPASDSKRPAMLQTKCNIRPQDVQHQTGGSAEAASTQLSADGGPQSGTV